MSEIYISSVKDSRQERTDFPEGNFCAYSFLGEIFLAVKGKTLIYPEISKQVTATNSGVCVCWGWGDFLAIFLKTNFQS